MATRILIFSMAMGADYRFELIFYAPQFIGSVTDLVTLYVWDSMYFDVKNKHLPNLSLNFFCSKYFFLYNGPIDVESHIIKYTKSLVNTTFDSGKKLC